MPPRRSVVQVTRDLEAMRQAMERQAEYARQRDERHAEEMRRRDEQLQQQTELINRLVQQLGQQGPRPAPPADEQPPPVNDPIAPEVPADHNPAPAIPELPQNLALIEPMYERFRRQQPPTFDGSADPSIAEDWNKRIQRIFNFMRLSDEEKVMCAVNQLVKGASYWWDLVAQTEDVTTMTWAQFLKLYNEKYLGEAVRTRKVHEFMDLRQGNLSVAEYVMKFEELARFAPNVVPTDEARMSKFLHGLRLQIVKQVDSEATGPQSYGDAVQRALRQDGWDRKDGGGASGDRVRGSDEKQDNRNKSSGRGQSSSQHGRFQRNFSGQSQNQSHAEERVHSNRDNTNNRNDKRPREHSTSDVTQRQQHRQGTQYTGIQDVACARCGKFHNGDCRIRSNQCYNCGKEGHYARDCPSQAGAERRTVNNPRPNARVYSLCEGEIEAGPSTTATGTMLIDSSVLHSLIAINVASYID